MINVTFDDLYMHISYREQDVLIYLGKLNVYSTLQILIREMIIILYRLIKKFYQNY